MKTIRYAHLDPRSGPGMTWVSPLSPSHTKRHLQHPTNAILNVLPLSSSMFYHRHPQRPPPSSSTTTTVILNSIEDPHTTGLTQLHTLIKPTAFAVLTTTTHQAGLSLSRPTSDHRHPTRLRFQRQTQSQKHKPHKKPTPAYINEIKTSVSPCKQCRLSP